MEARIITTRIVMIALAYARYVKLVWDEYFVKREGFLSHHPLGCRRKMGQKGNSKLAKALTDNSSDLD